jgi:hypothetical protein
MSVMLLLVVLAPLLALVSVLAALQVGIGALIFLLASSVSSRAVTSS